MDSPSVNECLEKGPNLVVLLFDTIIKLRSYPVRIVSDIEKAFHQVQISPFDRCMLRFLWFDDVKKDNSIIKKSNFDDSYLASYRVPQSYLQSFKIIYRSKREKRRK